MTNPSRLAEKIDQLKRLLVNARDFSTILNWFFDELAADPTFRAKGKPLKDKEIEGRFLGVIEVIKERLTPKPQGRAQVLAMLWLKDYKLAHGAFLLGDRFGAIFYFRDLDMGLCALGAMNGSAEVLFSRFSVYDQVDPSKSFHADRPGRRH